MSAVLPWIGLVLRLVIGGRLAWAGWQKINAFSWWRETVDQMSLFPAGAVGPLSGMLPGLELVIGGALILGFWTGASGLGAMLLHLVFAALMILVLARDVDTVCGCFGPDSEYPVDEQVVFLNLLSAAGALAIVFLPRVLDLDGVFGSASAE